MENTKENEKIFHISPQHNFEENKSILLTEDESTLNNSEEKIETRTHILDSFKNFYPKIDQIKNDIDKILNNIFEKSVNNIAKKEILLIFLYCHLSLMTKDYLFKNLILQFGEMFPNIFQEWKNNIKQDQKTIFLSIYKEVCKKKNCFHEILTIFIEDGLNFRLLPEIVIMFKQESKSLKFDIFYAIIKKSNIEQNEKLLFINFLLSLLKEKKKNVIGIEQINIKKMVRKALLADRNAKQTMSSLKNKLDLIINQCIQLKAENILILLYYDRNYILFDKVIIESIFEKKCLFFLTKIFKKKHKQSIFFKDDIFNKIIDYCLNTKTFLHGIHFITSLKMKSKNWKISHHLKVMSFFEDFLRSKKIIFLKICINPFQILILLAHFAIKMTKLESPFEIKYYNFANTLKKLALKFLIIYEKNLILCKLLIFSTTFPSNKLLLEILFEEKDFFKEILIQISILKTIKRRLNSSNLYDNHLLCASTSFLVLKKKFLNYNEFDTNFTNESTLNIKKTKRKMYLDQLFDSKSNINTKTLLNMINIFGFVNFNLLRKVNKTNHFYQFHIFIKSVYTRTYLEIIFYIAIFGILYFNINGILTVLINIINMSNDEIDLVIEGKIPEIYYNYKKDYSNDNISLIYLNSLYNKNNDISEGQCLLLFFKQASFNKNIDLIRLTQKFLDPCVTILSYQENSMINIERLKYTLILCMSYIVHFTYEKIYQIRLYKKYTVSISNLNSILIFLTSLGSFIILDNLFRFRYSVLIQLFQILRVFLVLLLFNLLLKFLFFLLISEKFGVLLKIVMKMMHDFIKFIGIFVFALFSFTCLMFFLFSSKFMETTNLLTTLLYLFGVSFGQFNLSYEMETFNILYSIFVIIFLFIINILYLNLLIAMISHTYESVIEDTNSVYGQILYELYKIRKYDKFYGAINLYPPPISFITFIPSLFLLKIKNENLNRRILKVGYFFFLIIFFLGFIIGNLIIIPIAWIKVLKLIVLGKYKMNNIRMEFKKYIILIHLISWFVFGPIYLLIKLFCYDIVIFIKSSFHSQENKIRIDKLPVWTFVLISRFIKILIKNNISKLSVENFTIKFFEFLEENRNFTSILLVNCQIEKSNNLKFKNEKSIITEFIEKIAFDNQIDIVQIKQIFKSLKYYSKRDIKFQNYKALNLYDREELDKIIDSFEKFDLK